MTSNAARHNLYHAPLSSYESLDKFNCTSETLKITDDYHQQKHNMINTMSQLPACEIISTNKVEQKSSSSMKQNQLQSMSNNYKLLNSVADADDYNRNGSMKRQSNHNEISDDYDSALNADDNEQALNKQKHLSDWYYIKTSPKAKPTSPYERRKLKNFLHHPAPKVLQAPLLLPSTDSYSNRNSSDKISSLNGDSPFIPIQKYRSNDYIEHHHPPPIFHEDKSPLQTHKCFSMKYSRNPSGRSQESKFGEMTSSSFEHVNVTGLHESRFSESDLRNDDDYVQSLRMAAAKMRPLPQAPAATTNNQESQVCSATSYEA